MTVHLVGAGPGDPGLITVKGADLLSRADVVIYDRLSAAELLDLAPPSAERICVAKRPNGPTVPQDEINSLLIEHGRRHACVVRLKGGDPFVFARGGEEAAALVAAGIDFEVVPGITSAIAVPAYAGIPVTLRHSSTSFTVVTGHEDPTKGMTSVDWEAVARLGGTIVVLMGVGRVGEICDALMSGGRPGDTPAAAVRWGTRPAQMVIRSTLDGLPGAIASAGLRPPATIVIGDVAAQELDWFSRRPLLGRTVVVTRARPQAPLLARRLADLGAAVVVAPVIAIEPPSDGGRALAGALASLDRYDWLVVTSVNGADAVLAACRDARQLAGVQVAAIGPGTSARLAAGGIVADLVPKRTVAEGLLAEFPAPPDRAALGASPPRVLLARAETARAVLPEGLAAMGWQIDDVAAYRNAAPEVSAETASEVAAADVVTFTSASTVRNLIDAVGAANVPPAVVSIGPATSSEAVARGLTVTSEADTHDLDGLVSAVVEWARSATVV